MTSADAEELGTGGEIAYIAEGTTAFLAGGHISSRGGENGGDGGFVEVSGLSHVGVGGSVDTTAPVGAHGTFLIDPVNIDIVPGTVQVNGNFQIGTWVPAGLASSQIGADDIEALLVSGTNVMIDTAQPPSVVGPDSAIGNLSILAGAVLICPAQITQLITFADNILVNANISEGGVLC